MALTTISATLRLDNTASPPQAIVTDTTNYTIQGIVNLALLTGRIKLEVETATGPLVVYDNLSGALPDITPNTALTNNFPIPLPLDSDGKALQGQYTLTYRVMYLQIPDPDIVTIQNVYDYDFDLPEVCLGDPVINCVASTLSSTDETEYGAYVTTITRVHTIYPDPLLHIPNKIGSVSQLIYNDIGTGNWGTEVISTVTWTFPAGLMLTDTIEGCLRFVVTCSTDLCKVFCCLNELMNSWKALKEAGQLTEAERMYVTKIQPSFLYAELFIMAQQCGKAQSSLDMLFNMVKTTSGCSEACCKDDCPTLIIPVTSNNNGAVIVDSPDGTVTVTSEVIDGDTYFHLHVDLPPITLQPVVLGLDPIVVTPSVDPVTGQKIYTVSLNVTIPTVIQELEIMGVIAPSGSTWTFTPTYIIAQGSNLVDPVTPGHTYYLGSNEPTNPGANDFVALHYSAYQITPGAYTARANIMSVYPNDTVATIKTKLASFKTMEAEIMYVDRTFASDDFFMRIVSTIDGHPIKFGELLSNGDEAIGLLVAIQVRLLTT